MARRKTTKVLNQEMYNLVKEKYFELLEQNIKKSKIYQTLKKEFQGKIKPFDIMIYYQMISNGKNFEEATALAGYIASRR